MYHEHNTLGCMTNKLGLTWYHTHASTLIKSWVIRYIGEIQHLHYFIEVNTYINLLCEKVVILKAPKLKIMNFNFFRVIPKNLN